MPTRTCSICKSKKPPESMMRVGIGFLKFVCSDQCKSVAIQKAIDIGNRKRFRERKQKLDDTVSNWTKKAQDAFNSFIKLRDADQPCISCQKLEALSGGYRGAGGWDCGHYRSTGANPELRFEESNAHKQCSRPCNKDLSGNIVNYRIHLEKKIGKDKLAWLEGPHEPKRYRVDELKEIAKKYNALARELKRKRENDSLLQ